MALLDPADPPRRAAGEHHPTNHPMVCLIGGFGAIVAVALVVHMLFSLLP